jgi:hypothetical protein
MYRGTKAAHRVALAGRRKTCLGTWLALALVGVVAGCSNPNIVGGGSTQVAGATPVDGFLPHPELLTPGGPGRIDLVYVKPGLNFANYNAILLDPVVIITDTTSPLASASTQQRYALVNTYYSELFNALSAHCNMQAAPAPGTLRFTFALTDAKLSNGVVKTLANYTPYVSVAYKVGSLAFNDGVGVFSGTATSEAYATDSVSGALLWQGVDKRAGTNAVIQNTTNGWYDVDQAMKAWSAEAAKRLQELGVCHQ